MKYEYEFFPDIPVGENQVVDVTDRLQLCLS